MRNFLKYLKDHPGAGLQAYVAGHTQETTSKVGDILDFDDLGVTLAVRAGQNVVIEAYPWNAVRGLLTTLQPKTVFPSQD